MEISITGHVPVTGDCGHKFEIPIARIDDEFECPTCGQPDRFSDEQIASIKDQIRTAAGNFGAEEIAKSLGDHLAKSTRGFKHIKYRKK